MAQESSFDVVSQVDLMEVSNGLQQAQKEIGQGFDFKGTAAGIDVLGGDESYAAHLARPWPAQ